MDGRIMMNLTKEELKIELRRLGNNYDLSYNEKLYHAIFLLLEYIDDLEVREMYRYATTKKD
jgi:hypothetical protein